MSVACTTVNRNLTVRNVLITSGILKIASNVCKEIDEVREERLWRRNKENVTDLEEREKLMKKDKKNL